MASSSSQSTHGVEANSSALASTGESRETSVYSPDSESAATLQSSGSVPVTTTTAGRNFLDSDWNIIVKECSSLAAKWHTVSTYLGLPKEMVDQIEADHPKSVERCWSESLSKWIQQNAPEDKYGLPSWSTLLKAIVKVDPCLARKLASKYQCSLEEVTITSQTHQTVDDYKPSLVTKPSAAADENPPHSQSGVEMIRSNERKISAQFTKLLLAVQAALEASSDAELVRHFLVNFLKHDLPKTKNLQDLFESVALNNLWSYHDYGPLEEVINHFLSGNEEIATMMSEYKERLTGHYMTTKLIDYINYRKELFTSESDTESDEESIATDPSPPKLTKKLHKRIKVVLKLERKISTLSLQYVHNLWIAFAKEYDIPSLTAILEKIATGSLEISWLIPASFAERIRPRSRFFRKYGIVTVLMDGDMIYDENQMADKEQKFLRLFVERSTPVPKFLSLLDEGVDPDLYDKKGRHPLWYASFDGRVDLVELFLRYGASVDLATQGNIGERALATAVVKGYYEVVKVLVRHHADVNHRTKKGQSILWKVAFLGHTDIARHLLNHGAKVDLPNTNNFGETPLFAACARGHKATAALLVERGALVNYQRKTGNTTPLYVASQSGYVELVSLLLEKGADPNKGQQPPLYIASQCGHIDVVTVLVDHGADINKRCDDEYGATPLITACSRNQPEVAKLLIERGADVNLHNKNNLHSSLHIASQLGHTAIVEVLLHPPGCAQLELRDKEGRTALMVASWRGHLTAVQELLRAGALTDSQDQEGLTALILASQNGHLDVVDALIEFKANLDITENTAGWSALFFAVKTGNLEIVKRLVREGANIDIRDKNGLTADEISDDDVCTVELVSEVQTSQEEQDTSTDVSQSDNVESQGKKVEAMAEDQKKEVEKHQGEREQESKGHVQQQDTQEKKRELVKKSYQRLLRIFDVLEDSLLPGRKEKREYQKKKETPSNIAETNQQLYGVLST